MERTKLDGVVILPPMSERDDLAAALEAIGCAYVRIGAVALDKPGRYINCQDKDAAAQMASHFVELGHRRIGFIRGPQGYRSAAERTKGFRDGLRKAGLALERPVIRLRAPTRSNPACPVAGNYLRYPNRRPRYLPATIRWQAGF